VGLLGGVALFLFGMTLMGDGLKKVAGSKLEMVLYQLSGTPVKGIILGAGVTSIIQSSCATSVMVVGFVNSGMMKIEQAISVIHGALIGTSITGWILCLSMLDNAPGGLVSVFSTANLTALVAVIGICLRMFSKKQRNWYVGDILLGFAVLMYGMQIMSSSVSGLRSNETFINLLTTFSNPVLGIIVGAVFTAVIQSASAAVGILQALSVTGAITFEAAYPIILGIAVGASVPVLLSALNAKTQGKRCSFIYLIIELIAVPVFGAVYYLVGAFGTLPFKGVIMNPVNIALLNSVFRIIASVCLMPFNKFVLRIVARLVKESEEEKNASAVTDRLDERFLKHPDLAIEQCRISTNDMALASKTNLLNAIDLMSTYSNDGFAKVEKTEELIDEYEDKLGAYLIKITGRQLDDEQSELVSKYLHTLSDFERISDHAMNIAEVAQEINEKKLIFSEDGQEEITVLTNALLEIVDLSMQSFIYNDLEKAYRVEPLEEMIDVLCDEMKLRHVERLKQGNCSISHGFVFSDILTNFERVSDHCSNIAVAVIELQSKSYDAHGYVINLKELHAHHFDEYYNEYAKKYEI